MYHVMPSVGQQVTCPSPVVRQTNKFSVFLEQSVIAVCPWLQVVVESLADYFNWLIVELAVAMACMQIQAKQNSCFTSHVK